MRRGAFLWPVIAVALVLSAFHLSAAEVFQIEDGGVVREFKPALDEVHVKETGKPERVEKIAPKKDFAELRQHAGKVAKEQKAEVSPVLYEKGKARDKFSRRIVTRKVSVKLAPDANPKKIAAAVGATAGDELSFAKGTYIFESKESGGSISLAQALLAQPGVLSAQPLLGKERSKKFVPNDPLFPQQWHLRNTGQNGGTAGMDINVTNVWDTYRGQNSFIGIVDDGLQISHPDLSPNVNTVIDWDYRDNDSDPSPLVSEDFHGSSVSGVAAARGNNSVGVSGVAPEATLVGVRLIGGSQDDAMEASALTHSNQIVHIFSNSWGPADDGYTLEGPGSLTTQALQSAATSGRGSRGSIITWAGGNGGTATDNANYDGYANSMYTIAVGAVTDRGARATYSEPGCCLVISAPSGGDSVRPQALTTTDLTGSNGYNTGSTSGEVADSNYTQDFNGTSAATPVVSGVVALLLQANSQLGWRDVQEILMRSATKNDAANSGWFTNKGNFLFNHSYGAGLINANNAITWANRWRNLPARTNIFLAQTGLGITIPDNNSTGVTRTFDFSGSDLRVEHVTVTVNISHTFRGDLALTLTSPQGTASRLAEKHHDDGTNYVNWTFMSVFNWGEISAGSWQLKIADLGAADVGTLNSARVDIYGTPPNSPGLLVQQASGGCFDLTIDGNGGRTNLVQVSTNLTAWNTVLATNVANGPFQFTDCSGTNAVARFYRVIVP